MPKIMTTIANRIQYHQPATWLELVLRYPEIARHQQIVTPLVRAGAKEQREPVGGRLRAVL